MNDRASTGVRKAAQAAYMWLPFFWATEPGTRSDYFGRLYYNVGFQAVVFLLALIVAMVAATKYATGVDFVTPAPTSTKAAASPTVADVTPGTANPAAADSPPPGGADRVGGTYAAAVPPSQRGFGPQGKCFVPFRYDQSHSHWLIGLLAIALLTATIGAVVNNYQRVSQLVATPLKLPQLPDWYILNFQLWTSPLFAMIFAFMLIALFSSGLIQGSLFPNYNNTDSCFEHLPGLLQLVVPLTNADAVKVVVWCFVAGLFERFVPNILDSLVARSSTDSNQQRAAAVGAAAGAAAGAGQAGVDGNAALGAAVGAVAGAVAGEDAVAQGDAKGDVEVALAGVAAGTVAGQVVQPAATATSPDVRPPAGPSGGIAPATENSARAGDDNRPRPYEKPA